MALKDLTVDEVKEHFLRYDLRNDHDFNPDEFEGEYNPEEGDIDWYYWRERLEWYNPRKEQQHDTIPGLGTVTLEKQHGGEGQGDDYYLVFKVVDGDTTRFFKINGWYQSFHGGEYDGPFVEVQKVERMEAFYE